MNCDRFAVAAGVSTTEVKSAQYTLDKKPIGGPLIPISNNILVKVRSKDATSEGGIILPEKVSRIPFPTSINAES